MASAACFKFIWSDLLLVCEPYQPASCHENGRCQGFLLYGCTVFGEGGQSILSYGLIGAIVDVVAVLTDSVQPEGYVNDLRRRDKELAKGWGKIAPPFGGNRGRCPAC